MQQEHDFTRFTRCFGCSSEQCRRHRTSSSQELVATLQKNEEKFLESTLRGSYQWKVDHTPVSAPEENDVVAIDGDVSSKRMQLVITTKAMLRVMLKLKLKLILACDSTRKVSWNRWRLHVLGVVDCLHTFWPIAYLFTNREDAASHELLLRSVTEHFYHLTGETPDVKFTISDNSSAIFNAFKKVFPSAFNINCYFHFMCKNLCK